MASLTMTPSFLGGSAVAVGAAATKPTPARCGVVMVKAYKVTSENVVVKNTGKEETSNGRRDLMFAVAAAAACFVANIALADEPKRGSLEAKKKYAQVCVTMPTARICRN
eukprot:TRINITY_DN9505_c0_g1_i1.p1 TRINITY_DN9505_c0_g1~~TRINITY_DN9505_c0_g1_i1.p1  ORF type:complete len:110 (-),score=9.34 TRINITY_DN9505_c0_g1_i1:99-428(-)